MSTYYTIRLQKFAADDGFTGGERDLKVLSRRTKDNLPVENRETSLNDTGDDNLLREFEEGVILDVSPTISESRQANYVDKGLQGPQGVVVYQTTNNRRYSISARLVSRNIEEALKNFKNVNRLKSWMIPQDAAKSAGKFGRPPILRLNGYKEQFSNIPVVIVNLTINYPEDVDYIDCSTAMVPIIQTVDFELLESHRVSSIRLSASEVSEDDGTTRGQEFDLNLFKIGQLPGY